jgi:hypothetical protein
MIVYLRFRLSCQYTSLTRIFAEGDKTLPTFRAAAYHPDVRVQSDRRSERSSSPAECAV